MTPRATLQSDSGNITPTFRRIVDFDFSGGDEYWSATEDYWQAVREVWEEYFSAGDEIRISSSVNDISLFAALFQLANDYAEDATNITDLKPAIRSAIEPYIQ